ncbi:hypothetical protein HDV57DRAFT_293902 [Trichoderma longibrachiatum]|uniref:Uncharacterized protein n=1 Tax=Trichoderma longibrachiatum ATCC 18648 TaxID=983965 RepID=A0A2T4CCV6_TRILO|nr:hypothetical protein M440DRAFT_237015 [Trichoderma longibrachiatum ATCC 18648]
MLRILPAVQNGWWWHVVAFTSDGAPCYQQLLLLLLPLLLRLLMPFMFVSRTWPSRHTSGSLILVATAKIGLRGPDGDVRQPRRSRWKAMPPPRCRRTVGLLENKKDAGKEGRSPFVDAEPVRVSTFDHPSTIQPSIQTQYSLTDLPISAGGAPRPMTPIGHDEAEKDDDPPLRSASIGRSWAPNFPLAKPLSPSSTAGRQERRQKRPVS